MFPSFFGFLDSFLAPQLINIFYLCWGLNVCIPPNEDVKALIPRVMLFGGGAFGRSLNSESASCSVVSDFLRPQGLYSLWNSPGQNTGVGSLSLLHGDLPNPGIEPRSLTLQADSLPAEPQGKPKNTGVVGLSLLQRIFPTQESNGGLLHCRGILYQLSQFRAQGSKPCP